MNKPRLIFVPQLPTQMRYTEWWISAFYNNLKNYFSDIIIIGEKYINDNRRNFIKDDDSSFFNSFNSLKFETGQIDEYIDLELKDDDILLLADISFPGLFPNILYHKRPKKCYTICHGTSKNNLDIFEKDRSSKWKIESGNAELFDKIFVGSEYHKHKLGWHGVKVIGMPNPPFSYCCDENKEKTIDILSVSRKCIQKVDDKIESAVEEEFGKIFRTSEDTRIPSWSMYFDTLSSAKVLLITAREETYGYQIIDCFKYGNGCVPLAPNQFSYPELLPDKCLYNRYDIQGLIGQIRMVLNGNFDHNIDWEKDDSLYWDRLIQEIVCDE